MADPSLELIQLMLQRVIDKQNEHTADFIEVKEHLNTLEFSNASLSRRLDRVAGDVELIKRRLDLVPAV
jgi:predicted nuclease with TOPRIM domain